MATSYTHPVKDSDREGPKMKWNDDELPIWKRGREKAKSLKAITHSIGHLSRDETSKNEDDQMKREKLVSQSVRQTHTQPNNQPQSTTTAPVKLTIASDSLSFVWLHFNFVWLNGVLSVYVTDVNRK